MFIGKYVFHIWKKKRNNQSIYTTENYIIQCKGKRFDIVFVSTGFELIFDALELQHQSLSHMCRALSHLVTSAMKKNKASKVEVFFFSHSRSRERHKACA